MTDHISRSNPSGPPNEKHDVAELESPPTGANSAGVIHMEPEHRARVEKSLKKKLDLRCSLFVLIYIMNYLDRNNIAAARLKGLQTELKVTNTQYSTCLSILYVGYILMQVPSNMIINKISRPSLYIGAAMLLWGLVSTLSGVATSFAGMVVIRFFLGFIEAAFLPGALLILSKWYTRKELTLRNAILFCGNLISNAFSALVGAGVLSNMQGTLGHSAWRWLFWSKYMFLSDHKFCKSDPVDSRRRCHDGRRPICRVHPSRSPDQLSGIHRGGAVCCPPANDRGCR